MGRDVTKSVGRIEHSENKSIRQSGPFKNEIGPGLLQSNVQEACTLKEWGRLEVYATGYSPILSLLSEILARCIFVKQS